jgi:Spy/CpxP family protein refolding chaperone
MRKTIAAAAVAAASIALGGVAGATLGAPSPADDGDVPGWVEEALSGLVDDQTITQGQADAVEAALDEARPERGPGRRGHFRLTAAAEALDMTEAELHAALEEGQTLAEVAEANDVEVEDLIDALVAAQQEHLAEAVEAGRLTQEEADEILAGAEERVTALVNGELPRLQHRAGGPGRPGGRWMAPDEDAAAA